jgi:putative Mg2+ transporter-C (MgtC) family protein
LARFGSDKVVSNLAAILNAHPLLLVAVKLIVAMICGGIIGLERELNRKPAGLRTNILICMGATLLMITSRHISGGAPYTDPARLIAQILPGIGFIGAGVILQARGSVHGLTTAATILVVAAIGVNIGDGTFSVGLLTTLLIIFVLVLLRRVERFIVARRRLFHYTFKTDDPAGTLSRLLALLAQQSLRLEDFTVGDAGAGAHEVKFSVVTSVHGNARLIEQLPRLGTEMHATMHVHTD